MLTNEQIQIAQRIADAADEGGVIQAGGMLELCRNQQIGINDDPTLHTTTSLDRAWQLAGLDPEECRAALYD